MGSDNNCNNYYNVEQNMSSSPFYQTLNSQDNQNQDSAMKNNSNEWMSTEQSSDGNSSSQNQDSESESNRDQNMRSNSEQLNSRPVQKSYNISQQSVQMSAPQWNFPGSLASSYQRFYGDNHYGVVITPSISQQSSLISTPSSSLQSLNNEIPSQSHNQHIHQMQTTQHLKKMYYQGLKIFLVIDVSLDWFS